MPEFEIECGADVSAYFMVRVTAKDADEAIRIVEKQCRDGTVEMNDWKYDPSTANNFRTVDDEAREVK